MRRWSVLLCAILLCAACSEPPQKEIDRAQGAIDAARAAGAERYAAEAFGASTTALQQSRDAVQQRDYRLALSRALDASERAKEAATQAADNKAKARSESETAINTANVALLQMEGRLKAASAAKVPAQSIAHGRQVATDAGAALQKARAALRAGNYLESLAAVKTTKGELAEGIRQIDEAIDARSPRAAKRKR
jgi:hypothetical protein